MTNIRLLKDGVLFKLSLEDGLINPLLEEVFIRCYWCIVIFVCLYPEYKNLSSLCGFGKISLMVIILVLMVSMS